MRIRAFLVAALIAILPVAADAAGKPGEFDYYVLSLSWSPSYCELAKKTSGSQCGERFGLVVHGLWPQYEKGGWPEFCVEPAPTVPGSVVGRTLAFMPDRGLIKHEWAKHGTCYDGYPSDYFATARKAFGKINAPVSFEQPQTRQSLDPATVASLFMAANPGLTERMISVTCRKDLLQEVRVCLDRDLKYRDCAPDVQAQSCSSTMALPPVK